MINNEAAAAVTFSGEAAEMVSQNKHLHYVVPSEGSNLWFDNIVIPKTAKNYAAAYAFYQLYARAQKCSPKCRVCRLCDTKMQQLKNYYPKEATADQAFYPSDEVMNHLTVYKNLGPKYLGIYNDLFLSVKMYRK